MLACLVLQYTDSGPRGPTVKYLNLKLRHPDILIVVRRHSSLHIHPCTIRRSTSPSPRGRKPRLCWVGVRLFSLFVSNHPVRSPTHAHKTDPNGAIIYFVVSIPSPASDASDLRPAVAQGDPRLIVNLPTPAQPTHINTEPVDCRPVLLIAAGCQSAASI